MAEVVVYDKDTGRIEHRSRGNVKPDLFQLDYPDKGIFYSPEPTDWAASYIQFAEDGEVGFLHGMPRSARGASGFSKPFACDLMRIPDPREKKEDQKELAIFRPIGVGDIVMSLPALSQLREKYKDWYITYWTTAQGARVLAGVPWLDKIGMVRYDRTKSLKPEIPSGVDNFDCAINWAGTVDFGHESWEKSRADMFCETAAVEPPKQFSVPSLRITQDQKHWAILTLGENGVRREKMRVGCVLSSHGESRWWPVAKWEQVATRMQEVQFLWFSDNELHMTASSPSNVFNTANQLFFEEYIALLDACDLIVCPDTSAYHLGEMLGVPSLVLEGSVDLKTRTKYYKHAHSVGLRKKLPCQPCHDFQARRDCYRQEDSPWCLSQITAQRVVRAIKKLLSTTSS